MAVNQRAICELHRDTVSIGRRVHKKDVELLEYS